MISFTKHQQKAMQIDRHIVVNAGAGSGKTSVLVHRLLNILTDKPDMSMHQILAITFTKKAAAELKQRLVSLIDTQAADKASHLKQHMPSAYISTIHGFCHRLIHDHMAELELDPLFSVMDDAQSQIVWQQLLETFLIKAQLDHDDSLKRILLRLSFFQLKQDLIQLFSQKHRLLQLVSAAGIDPPYTYESLTQLFFNHPDFEAFLMSMDSQRAAQTTKDAMRFGQDIVYLFLKAWQAYMHWKHEQAVFDYDDLMEKAMQVLKKPAIQAHYRRQFRFIMIDECQDTDAFQWELLRLLCEPFEAMMLNNPVQSNHQNFFLVGDLKQSIYSFRGADPGEYLSIMRQLKDNGVDVVELATNFRTQPQLISGINSLFSGLFSDAIPFQPLEPARDQINGKLSTCHVESKDEAEQLAQYFLHAKASGIDWSDMALLCRRKTNMKAYKQLFESKGIPVQMSGSQRFFQSQDLSYCLALMKFLHQPSDNLSLSALLTSPIFSQTYQSIVDLYKHHKHPLLIAKIKASSDPAWQHIYAQITSWRSAMATQPFPKVLAKILLNPEVLQRFSEDMEIESVKRLQIFNHFIHEQWKHSTSQSMDILHYIQRLQDIGASEPEHPFQEPLANAVQMMTIHASKGLEFGVVAVAECHKLFNFSKQDRWAISKHGLAVSYKHDPSGTDNAWRTKLLRDLVPSIVEEEQRLFYVACTRAKNYLLLTGQFDKVSTQEHDQSYVDFMVKHVKDMNRTDSFSDFFDLSVSAHESHDVSQSSKALAQNHVSRVKASQDDRRRMVDQQLFVCSVTDALLFLSCPKLYALKPSLPLLAQQHGMLQHMVNDQPMSDLFESSSDYHQPLLLFPELENAPPLLWAQNQQSVSSSLRKALRLPAYLYGTLVHFVIELVNLGQPFTVVFQATCEWLKGQGVGRPMGNIDQPLRHFMDSYKKSSVFYQISASEQVFHEYPISFYAKQTIIEGRLDTMFRSMNGWHVVDYKTDVSPTQDRLDHYKHQLALYFLALNDIWGQTLDTYSGTLLFTEAMHSETVTFTHKELGSIRKKLEQMPYHLSHRTFSPPPASQCKACPVSAIVKDCRHRPMSAPSEPLA